MNSKPESFAGNRYLKCLKSPTNANKQKINLTTTTTTMMIWSMNIHINISLKPSRINNVNFIGKNSMSFFNVECNFADHSSDYCNTVSNVFDST